MFISKTKKSLHLVLLASSLLFFQSANAVPFNPGLSITGFVELDTVDSFGPNEGKLSKVQAGMLTETEFSASAIDSGSNPLNGMLTDIGDSFHFDSKSGVVSGDEFLLGIDSSVVLSNTLTEIVYVVLRLDFFNRVDSLGAAAYADAEFILQEQGQPTETFFSHLVSDTENGNTVNGNSPVPAASGGPLQADGFTLINLTLAASEIVTLDLDLTVNGGDFVGGIAEYESAFTLTVQSAVVPLPAALPLFTLAIGFIGLRWKQT